MHVRIILNSNEIAYQKLKKIKLALMKQKGSPATKVFPWEHFV